MIFATTSFGIGVDAPNIQLIIVYGGCRNIYQLVQEFGHTVRNGMHVHIVFLYDKVVHDRIISSLPENSHARTLAHGVSMFASSATGTCNCELICSKFDTQCDINGHANLCTVCSCMTVAAQNSDMQ